MYIVHPLIGTRWDDSFLPSDWIGTAWNDGLCCRAQLTARSRNQGENIIPGAKLTHIYRKTVSNVFTSHGVSRTTYSNTYIWGPMCWATSSIQYISHIGLNYRLCPPERTTLSNISSLHRVSTTILFNMSFCHNVPRSLCTVCSLSVSYQCLFPLFTRTCRSEYIQSIHTGFILRLVLLFSFLLLRLLS